MRGFNLVHVFSCVQRWCLITTITIRHCFVVRFFFNSIERGLRVRNRDLQSPSPILMVSEVLFCLLLRMFELALFEGFRLAAYSMKVPHIISQVP